jgi:glycosyltransferase involved in cell wall biosynthesis
LGRVLVLGHAPLPWEDLTRFYAPGTRTWQFAKPLIDDGHEVTILAARIPFTYPDDMEPVVRLREHGCEVCRVDQTEFEAGGFTDRLMSEGDPDCVVCANSYPSYVGSLYVGERPMWADENGSLLAEAQAKAAVYGDDSSLEHFFRMNRRILEAADVFSAVSLPQKHELIGELAVLGRLNSRTYGYEFVHALPVGVQDMKMLPPRDPTRGSVKKDDFIVLWSGGYNTWTDIETLFEGLELAMEESPRVRFVSTGGEIRGHDEKTYPRFHGMVERSRFPDRYHLKGWVSRSEAMSYYATASVGINIDDSNYEVMFGYRNRIVEWALSGLPAISTDLCELTARFAAAGLLFPFPAGSPRGLADRIIELEADRAELARASDRIRSFVLEEFTFEKTTAPLRAWVRSPTHAPDFSDRLPLRIEALEQIRRAMIPPITPDSPLGEKLKFYLRNEGPISTLGRAATFLHRKTGGVKKP